MTTVTDLRLVMSTMAPPGGGLVTSSSAGAIPCIAESGLPRIRSDLDINDSTLFAVYCFIKNFIGLSKDAEQRVSSFKITSIVYHHLSEDEDITDDEIFDSPVCKWSKFCNKCNQFITSTHYRNTRSTQTAAKMLYTGYPSSSRDTHLKKISPQRAQIAAGNGTAASQIQSSMSEFHFPTTTRNTSIQYSPSLSSIPCDPKKKWPIFHLCPTTTPSIMATSSNTNESSLSSNFLLNQLSSSIPFSLNTSSNLTVTDSKSVDGATKSPTAVASPIVTITYRCLDPRLNISSDSSVGVNAKPKPTKPQIIVSTSEYIQHGTPTEILFARHNMSARENSLYNTSSPNVSRLFERSNIPFDYTPNEGVNHQNFRGNVNSRPSISSIPRPALNPQRSYPCFRLTPDELRPAITQIPNSGSVLSVPRYYSEPIFSTSAEKTVPITSPPQMTPNNTKPQYVIITESEPKFGSTYQRCHTVPSGSMGPIASPSIYIPGLCNQSLFAPFNNIVLNVNPNSDTSIKFTNPLQNSNNLEIFIQSLNTSNATPSKLNVDKQSSPIKVVASGKNKYCTLCMRTFCGHPDVFAENSESETVSRDQNSGGSNCPISIPSGLFAGSDSRNENCLYRRLDPF